MGILPFIIWAMAIVGFGCAVIFCYFIVPWLYGRWQRVLLKLLAVKTKSVVFTFDDGPSDVTPDVLAVLRQYNVKATFFLGGARIAGRESIVRQIVTEGHEIGSHAYSHLHQWHVSPISGIRDIKRGWQAIDNALEIQNGKYPFRPPYGKLNLPGLLYLWAKRVPVIFWTIDSRDIAGIGDFDSRRNAMLIKKEGGAVILAHDYTVKTKDKVISSLRASIMAAREMGMAVRTISELRDICRVNNLADKRNI